MATIRLIPSVWYNGASGYVTIADEENAFTNTDSTTYTTATNTNASTSSRYIYLRGFNFDDMPDGATVNSFTVKVRGNESGAATSASYAPSLTNGTSAISNTTASSNFDTTVATITVPTGALTWQQITNYGSNFSIRLNARRSSRNNTSYLYIYGAEIDVDYTPASPPVDVTISLSGSGTVEPAPGTYEYYEGDTLDLTITPTNESDTVTATKNGTSLTLTKHTGGSYNDDTVLGSYALVSGSFNGSGATYFQGLVGKGHTSTTTTSNYYSGGSSTIAVFTYAVGFDIPDNATITSVYALVNGHAESTSQSSEYMCARLISGSTNLSDELNFKSIGTSNSTQTITANVTPTIAQLAEMKLQCRLGYYGGAINGATVYVEYTVSGVWYTCSTTIDSDTTIAVVIGGGSQPKFYIKNNGTWTQVSKIYLKVNGSWVEQASSTWSTLFSTDITYRKMT